MQSWHLWLAGLVIILTGWAIIKKYQVNMVLLIAGLVLYIIAVCSGSPEVLPSDVKSTGSHLFDFFEIFKGICTKQIAGLGFIILVSGGFATYMKACGASDRFVSACAKPISLLKNPYLILAFVFILGHYLGLVITSASGMAMLLIVTAYPLIINAGCSSLAAAAVVASVLCISYAPASGVAMMACQILGMDPVQYLVKFQLIMSVPIIIMMAITHVIVQHYFDKKDNVTAPVADLGDLAAKQAEIAKTPFIYAFMPILPLVLLLIFNKMVYRSIILDVATAMIISWFVCFLVDLCVRRNIKESFDLSFTMFKGMGSLLTSTVGLIFVAAFFAGGLEAVGLINFLIDGAKDLGLGRIATGTVLSAVIGFVTILTGSGDAAFVALGHIVPDVAKSLGTDGICIMLMMHTASDMLRAISPVAGVIIIVSGFAKVSPFTIVKRTCIPCIVGYLTMLITVSLLFGNA